MKIQYFLVNQWPATLSHDEIGLLCELTVFEPVTQGCYIFFPVNWYVTRSSGNNNMKSKPMEKHVLKLSPVQMDRRLMKRTEQLE